MGTINLSFDQIALSRSEMRYLRKAAKEKVELRKCSRLKNLGLVDEERKGMPGYTPTPTGFAEINQDGINYLAYIKGQKQSKRKAYRHDWSIAIFSTLLGALVSRPLWEFIDWIRTVLFGL